MWSRGNQNGFILIAPHHHHHQYRIEQKHLYSAKLTQHHLMRLRQEKGKSRDMPGQNPNLVPARGDILWSRVCKSKQGGF